MRDFELVSYELSVLKCFYANEKYLKETSVVSLARLYESTVKSAPLELTLIYYTFFKYNNGIDVAAESLQLSARTINRRVKRLKLFLSANLPA